MPSLGADAADRSLIGRRLRFLPLQSRLPVIEGTVNFQGLGAELCILIIIGPDIVARLRIGNIVVLFGQITQILRHPHLIGQFHGLVDIAVAGIGHGSLYGSSGTFLSIGRHRHFGRCRRSGVALYRQLQLQFAFGLLGRKRVFDLERHVGHLRNDYASHFQNDLFDLADRSDTRSRDRQFLRKIDRSTLFGLLDAADNLLLLIGRRRRPFVVRLRRRITVAASDSTSRPKQHEQIFFHSDFLILHRTAHRRTSHRPTTPRGSV